MMNGHNHRFVPQADVYQPKQRSERQTLTLSMWRDGSGEAEIDGKQLSDFVKFIDNTPHGRLRVIKMLRQAAELIEQEII